MLVALDLTGDMISYAYFDGNDVVTETLRNTIGYRTGDLFQSDGPITQLIRMAKDMIGFSGVTATEAVCAVPTYCSYADRERIRRAAADCDLTVKYMVKGTFASAAMLFQKQEEAEATILLCSVHSDYADILVYEVGGAVLRVLASTTIRFDKNEWKENPDKLMQKTESELKEVYRELGFACGEKNEVTYITVDEHSEQAAGIISEILEATLGKAPVSFENDPAAGAFYHLMKKEDYNTDRIKKFFTVDCCVEGISISSGIGGEMVEVFRRNSEFPEQKVVELLTTHDNVLCFYGGNYRNREYDEPIGTCRIPEQYRGQKIYVKITLTETETVEYVVLDAKKQIIYPRRALS